MKRARHKKVRSPSCSSSCHYKCLLFIVLIASRMATSLSLLATECRMLCGSLVDTELVSWRQSPMSQPATTTAATSSDSAPTVTIIAAGCDCCVCGLDRCHPRSHNGCHRASEAGPVIPHTPPSAKTGLDGRDPAVRVPPPLPCRCLPHNSPAVPAVPTPSKCNARPPLESSRRGEFRSPEFHFL